MQAGRHHDIEFVADVEVIHEGGVSKDLGVLYPVDGGVWLVEVDEYWSEADQMPTDGVKDYTVIETFSHQRALALFKTLKEWRMMVNRVDDFQKHQ